VSNEHAVGCRGTLPCAGLLDEMTVSVKAPARQQMVHALERWRVVRRRLVGEVPMPRTIRPRTNLLRLTLGSGQRGHLGAALLQVRSSGS